MTKKDYIAIAAKIKGLPSVSVEFPTIAGGTTLTAIPKPFLIEALARAFEADNPNFDYAKFYDACDNS